MPQQYQADLGGGGESREASKSRGKNGLCKGTEYPTIKKPSPYLFLHSRQGSPALQKPTTCPQNNPDGQMKESRLSEKRVKGTQYSGADQSNKSPKNQTYLKRNENNISKISEAKVFESRLNIGKPRLGQKLSHTDLRKDDKSLTESQSKSGISCHSTNTSDGLHRNNKTTQVEISNVKDKKACGEKSDPTANDQGTSSLAKSTTAKSSTNVPFRTTSDKSKNITNNGEKPKTFASSSNVTQDSSTQSSPYERSDILVRAQMINEHWDKMDSSNRTLTEKSETHLPPVKLLKTPSAMHELVNRALLSNLAEEPIQLRRRCFVKLPPLTKKKEVDSKLANTQKYVTGRRLYNDRKVVNKSTKVGGKETGDSKSGYVSKEGKVQPTNRKVGGWK